MLITVFAKFERANKIKINIHLKESQLTRETDRPRVANLLAYETRK